MNALMTVIIEAGDISKCTPATISRCAIVYMKDDIFPLKSHINSWLKSLPQYLSDCIEELDLLCSYFIPEILEKFMI